MGEMTAPAAAAATAIIIIEPEKRSGMIVSFSLVPRVPLGPWFRASRWQLIIERYTNLPRLRKAGVMAAIGLQAKADCVGFPGAIEASAELSSLPRLIEILRVRRRLILLDRH